MPVVGYLSSLAQAEGSERIDRIPLDNGSLRSANYGGATGPSRRLAIRSAMVNHGQVDHSDILCRDHHHGRSGYLVYQQFAPSKNQQHRGVATDWIIHNVNAD
jgi:hypothetical protein